MLKKFNFTDSLSHAFSMLQVIMETPFFIKQNKLWKGFLEYKWIGILMLIISVLFSWYFLCDLRDHLSWDDLKMIAPANISSDLGAASNLANHEEAHTMISGGTKYLLLILLEVIIYSFCVRSLSILSKENNTPTFKEFYKAEIRMIKLMAWSFGIGIAIQVVLSIFLGIIGMRSLTDNFMFLVYTYFIGYAFLDNYNEQFGFKLKASRAIIRQHIGAAFLLGFLVSLLLYIPLIGPLLAPIFGGVSATIYGHRYALQNENEVFEMEKSEA